MVDQLEIELEFAFLEGEFSFVNAETNELISDYTLSEYFSLEDGKQKIEKAIREAL